MPARKTVAIVGSHIATRADAPWSRKYVDIWVFNEAVSRGLNADLKAQLEKEGKTLWKPPRVNAVFQMHKPVIWKNPENRNDPQHYEWLQQPHDFAIFMLDKYEEVPASEKYPLYQICKNHLSNLVRGRGIKAEEIRPFSSTVAYALALAIHQGYQSIELYGVEMHSNTEYTFQRDNVFFWLGVAIGKGIKVHIHPKSNLFNQPLYGYEGDVTLGKDHFTKRLGELVLVHDDIQSRVDQVNAAQMVALKSAEKVKPGDTGPYKAYMKTIQPQGQAMIDLGAVGAAMDENRRYLKKAEAMLEAAGDILFSRQEFEQTAAHARDVQQEFQKKLILVGQQAQDAWKTLWEVMAQEEKDQDLIDQRGREYAEKHEGYLTACYEFGRSVGITQENLAFLHSVDQLIKAAGGKKSEEVILAQRKNGKGHKEDREDESLKAMVAEQAN